MKNTAARYGFVTKVLRWAVFLLILNPFVVRPPCSTRRRARPPRGSLKGRSTTGTSRSGGSRARVALARFVWRKAVPLPDWAPSLSAGE